MRPLRETGLSLAQVRKLPAAVDVTIAAKALGISRATAYQSISDGTFPVATIRVSRRLRVLTADLVRVLEGNGDRAAAS